MLDRTFDLILVMISFDKFNVTTPLITINTWIDDHTML